MVIPNIFYLDGNTFGITFANMAAMIQVPTKLPETVVVKIKKAVEKKEFENRNAAIVVILKKYFKVK